ncbi:Unknown protein sequence [Pseudomonas syringae pv. maculicola]|nr:Unknown protein sequence [Pseudomonas syringae pv. maculicola]
MPSYPPCRVLGLSEKSARKHIPMQVSVTMTLKLLASLS